MKAKHFICGGMVLLFVALIIGLLNAGNRLTYIEYTDLGQQADTYLTMDTKGQELVQELQMPYDIIHGISIQIGTFNRDNNSEWDVSILEPKSGKLICQKHFNASLIVDNGFHYIEL